MVSRRHFLAGLGAATVLGFNPALQSWVTAAHASTPLHRVPDLDGTLLTDAASLATAAVDAGNIVQKTPLAVLRPGSVDDIQRMVRFCKRHRIRVAARGQGHTTFGQAQVKAGLVIDMSSLNTIHSMTPDGALVDAGVLWKDLLESAFPLGLTPPVLTGFTALSVGGTLSVGGCSAANRSGAQVDRVQWLEVVTGDGDVRSCSERRNSNLFEAALAGLGQCGIITRAMVDLVPAQPMARQYLLNYFDNASFFSDLRTLLNRGEFDRVFTLWFPDPNAGWLYQINAVKFFGDEMPDDGNLLRDISPVSLEVSDVTYLEHVLSVDGVIDFFKQIGLWDGVQHPWFDVFLPGRTVERYVGEVLPTLTPDDVGPTGFLLMLPLKRSSLRRPFFRVPNDEWVFLFDILTAAPAPGPNPAFVEAMLARNRSLFEKARRMGGTRYPIGSLNFSRLDWVLHYGERWLDFAWRKFRYDPKGILTPGPGIF